MAEPQSNQTVPGAQEGPAYPPGFKQTANPLAETGYAQLGKEIAELNDKIRLHQTSVEELSQSQANLIDSQKALAVTRTEEMTANDKLQNQIKKLTKAGVDQGFLMGDQISELRALEDSLTASNVKIGDMSKSIVAMDKAFSVIISARAKMEATYSTQGMKMAQQAGAEMLKASGAVGQLGKSTATSAAKWAIEALGMNMAKFVPVAGQVLMAVDAVNQVMRAATKESKTYADTFAGSLGLAMNAQAKFITGIDLMAMGLFNIDKIREVGSATMRAGAFDAYAVALRRAGTDKTLAATSNEVSHELGGLSADMIRVGTAMGLTEQQAGGMLASLTAMGAVSQTSGKASTDLTAAINRMGAVSRMTGIAFTHVMSNIEAMADTAIPMGASFNDLAMQSGLAMKALQDYAAGVGDSGNQYLKVGSNMETMVKAMTSAGAAISPMQNYGYQLVTGMAKAGEPIKGLIDSMVGSTPLTRMGEQMRAFKQMSGGDPNKTALMMMQSGLPQQFAPIMRDLLSNPKTASALQLATSARGAAGDAESNKQMAGLDVKAQEDINAVANQMQLMQDPLTLIAQNTGNAVTLLGVIAGHAASGAEEKTKVAAITSPLPQRPPLGSKQSASGRSMLTSR